MAKLDLSLTVEFKPTYYALLSCAAAIAAERGDDTALEWAGRVLKADFELFCVCRAEQPKPALRLINGGRDV